MTNHERDDWGDDGGIGPLLGAYADERLAPDPERTAAARERLMHIARRQLGAARPPERRGTRLAGWNRPRGRLAVPAAAAVGVLALALAGGVAVAGSGPGEPLYGARLWFEEVTLPAEPGARADAETARLDARLAEAEAAAEAGNGGAVTAALDAYRDVVGDAWAAAGADTTLQARIEVSLRRHVAVLAALEGRVPGQASDAIRAAVERAEARIEEVLAAPPGHPVAPGATAPASALPGATPAPTPRASSVPHATPKASHGPDRTPPGKPQVTPAPHQTAAPDHTPPGKPDASPKPTKAPKLTPAP